MTLKELANAFGRMRQDLTNNRQKDAALIAADLTALVKIRIQSTGKNFEEQQFEDYTTPYAKKRKKRGLQTQRVDFTDTGRMWASVQPRVTAHNDRTTQITVKAGDDENQTKLNGQFRKRGNILLPTEKELQRIQALNKRRVIRVMQQNLQ